MNIEVKEIEIKHPTEGDITINTAIPDEINESIGEIENSFGKDPGFYHATVIKNKDGTFDIKNLKVIKPDSVNVGWFSNSKGNRNYINVIKNLHVGDDLTIYPSGIISVIYN